MKFKFKESSHFSTLVSILSAITLLVCSSNLAQAQSDREESQQETQAVVSQDAEDSVEAANLEEDPVELDPQRVTGTRLQDGDSSAQVYSFTTEDISRHGFSNLEEFFRKMPWTSSSMNT